jgi:uncharacterized membrane protein
MSEKESKFINWLSGILGTFLIAMVIGGFSFVWISGNNDATQSEKIRQNEIKIETMRTEIRQDLKEIKMNIDKIAESQARNNH